MIDYEKYKRHRVFTAAECASGFGNLSGKRLYEYDHGIVNDEKILADVYKEQSTVIIGKERDD
jgi:hypothetical protein